MHRIGMSKYSQSDIYGITFENNMSVLRSVCLLFYLYIWKNTEEN